MKHRFYLISAATLLIFAHIPAVAEIYTPPSCDELKERAEAGDMLAMAMLTESILRGEWGGSTFNNYGWSSPCKWLEKAADNGIPVALYYLGMIYEYGIDGDMQRRYGKAVAKDADKSKQYYEKSFAGLDAGKETADPRWLMNLSYLHERGLGTPTNLVAALELRRKSAEMGYVRAQLSLGLTYWIGKGVAQDEAEAVKWFRLAAEQGDRWAQYNLGVALLVGKGVIKDKAEAMKWLRVAAQNRHVAAIGLVGIAKWTGDGVPIDRAEGLRELQEAARRSDPISGYYASAFALAQKAGKTSGLPTDLEQAVTAYNMIAAEREPVISAWRSLRQNVYRLLDARITSEGEMLRSSGIEYSKKDGRFVTSCRYHDLQSDQFSPFTDPNTVEDLLNTDPNTGEYPWNTRPNTVEDLWNTRNFYLEGKDETMLGAGLSFLLMNGLVVTNLPVLTRVAEIRTEILKNAITVENLWSNINVVAALPDGSIWTHNVDRFVLFDAAESVDVSKLEDINRQVESQAKRGANILKFYQPFLALIHELEQGRKEWLGINPVGYSSQKDFSDFPFIEQAVGAAYDAADDGAPTEYYQRMLESLKGASVFEKKRIEAFRQCLQDIESNTVDWSGAKYGFQSCPTIKSKPQVYKKIALGMNDDCLRLLLKSESTNIVETKTEDGYHLTWKDGDRNIVLFFNKQDALWKVSIEVPGVSLGDLEAKYKKEFGVSFAMEPEDGYPMKIVEKPRVLTTPNVSLTYEPNFYEETEPVVVATEVNKGYLIGTFNDGAVQVSIGPGGTVKQIGALDSGSGKSETLWTYKNGVLTTTPKGDSVCLQPPRGPSPIGLVSAHAQVAREQYGITLCEVQKEKERLDRTLESLKDSPSVIITSLEWQGFYAKALKEKADMEAAEKAKKEQEEKQSKLDF